MSTVSEAKTAAGLADSNTKSAKQDLLHRPATRAALPFINGFLSGAFATTCIQPIDTVKVRIQLTGEGVKGGPKPNPLTVARGIVASGGVGNLYSGLSAGYLRQLVYGTCRLGFFGTFIDLLEQRAAEKGTKIGFAERSGAGLTAGGIAALIGNPAEVCLIRMQSDGLKPPGQRANYNGVVSALRRIAQTEGIGALWSGAYPTAIRAMATNFGQLTFFAETKHQLTERTDLSVQARTVIASGVAGFFAAFFSLPFDFVKTRLQRQSRTSDGSLPYKGMADCFVKVAREEGLMRFYRGFGTYFMRIAPHSVIALIAFDYLGFLTR